MRNRTDRSILVYFPNFGRVSGIQVHFRELLAELVRMGWRCEVLALRSDMDAVAVAHYISPDITFTVLAAGAKTRVARLSALINWIRRNAFKFDVVYTNGNSISAPVVWSAASRSGFVMHHHHTAGDREEQRVWQPMYSVVLRRAPVVIACSASTAANIESHCGRAVNFLPYLTPQLKALPSLRQRRDVPVCGYFGRFATDKGFSWFVSAARELNGKCKFLLVGDTVAPFEDTSNLTIRPPYSSLDEYCRLLATVDFVALPSTHHEGMPLMLMEALSVGIPFVATNRGGVTELAAVSRESIVTGADYRSFVEGLTRMIACITAGTVDRDRIATAYEQAFGRERAVRSWMDFIECRCARN